MGGTIVSALNLRKDDFFICCDRGLKHQEGLGITPNLIVGDFDANAPPIWTLKPLYFLVRRTIPIQPLR